nr:putative late blight resistance protein homolog R1B-16 [Ipomoea batatas]
MGMRYFIVLDDIWSLKAWAELNRAFPSCDNGSRVVLTSRQESVVPDVKHIFLPFFTVDESWELLQVKLFKGKGCPKELETIGKNISKKCGGLPFVVGLVAGLLRRVEKRFIDIKEKERVEDAAEDFLNHLVASNLVMVSKRKYDGHILSCGVHDLLTSGSHAHLPKFFWNMKSLRHMVIHHDCLDPLERPSVLEPIPHGSEILQTLDLETFLSKDLLMKLPGLKKIEVWGPTTRLDSFAEIDFLHHLESLELSGDTHYYPDLLNDLKPSKFPSNVKEIHFCMIIISSSAISIIAQLSKLEVLTLSQCVFDEGFKWNVDEKTQFCKLKYLKLFFLDGTRIWNVSVLPSPFLALSN